MTGRLVMVGISHIRAPQASLDRVAVRHPELPDFLVGLRAQGFTEAVVLSTCSRTEIYTVGRPGQPTSALVAVLASRAELPRADAEQVVEVRAAAGAVRHLFRVTAGLESRVVGEADVQAQVRRAQRSAGSLGMTGRLLQRLFPAALRSAEHAHCEAALGHRTRSLAHRAVDIGLQGLTPGQARTLVVGSGQVAGAAFARLTELGQQARVAARNEAYAARLAGPYAACSLTALVDEIRQSDLLICATSAAQPVVTVEHLREAMRGRTRPLTVVDLSVPRNVDPAVAGASGVRLVEMAALNDDARDDPVALAAVRRAEDLVRAAADRFVDDIAAREAGPLIRALREQVELTCRLELGWRAPQLAPEALDQVAHAVAGKLSHAPTLALRAAAAAGDDTALRRLAEAYGLAARAAEPAA